MTLDDYFHLFAAALTKTNVTFGLLEQASADNDKLKLFREMAELMSSHLTAAIWQHDIDPFDKLILLAFADNAMHDGLSTMTIPDLRKLTGLELDTLRLRLKLLEQQGYLLIDTQYSERGVKLRHLYILNTHKLKEEHG